jgi:hypothetical protein
VRAPYIIAEPPANEHRIVIAVRTVIYLFALDLARMILSLLNKICLFRRLLIVIMLYLTKLDKKMPKN